MNGSEKKIHDLETKEGFCGACVAGIGALAGLGTAAGSTKVDKKKRTIVFWVGCGTSILFILILIYLLFIKKCTECM